MTREEAIKLLEHISIAYTPTDAYGDYDDPQPYEEAIDMAIESLSNYTTKKPNGVVEQKNDVVAEPTDLISRADAIEAVAELWLSEASAESPYVNDDDIGAYRKLAEELFADIPSADRPSGEWEIYYPFMLSVEDQKSYRIKDPKEPIPDKRFGRIRCSVCKEDKHKGNNFCSNCGADMRGERNE